jgi:hypothetical protein
LRRSVDDGCREDEVDPSPRRLITLDALDGFSGSPRIGAEGVMGEPGVTAMLVRDAGASGTPGEL